MPDKPDIIDDVYHSRALEYATDITSYEDFEGSSEAQMLARAYIALRGKELGRNFCAFCRGTRIHAGERPSLVDGVLMCKLCREVYLRALE